MNAPREGNLLVCVDRDPPSRARFARILGIIGSDSGDRTIVLNLVKSDGMKGISFTLVPIKIVSDSGE